jgi:hypothetical protein
MGLYIKPFTDVIYSTALKANAFATDIHFHPSLLFAVKARTLTLKCSLSASSTWVGSNFGCQYQTNAEVIAVTNTPAYCKLVLITTVKVLQVRPKVSLS